MRFVATTGSTRTIVYGDAFAQNELSPVETLVVSLAACSAMDVVAIAIKKRQVFDRYAVHVEAEQRDEYPQVLTRVRVVHEVEGPGRRGGGDPPRDRAVGHEVLPGQRDDLGRRDRGPPRLSRHPNRRGRRSTSRARSWSRDPIEGLTSSAEIGRCGHRRKVCYIPDSSALD